MACFQIIMQLLIRLLASFCIYGGQISLGIWVEIEGLHQQISYWSWQRLFQGYFKSYRIALSVALWLDFEQLSTYLFVYRRFYRAAISKCYMEFDTKLEDWIKRNLIETWHRLFQGCFKSYRIALSVALWLDFEQLSTYLFVYRRFYRAAISKCYMEFDTKLEDWIKRNLI